ncbi:MAG: hypothetical protein ACRDHN_10420 [Thermomicrobiales bacterium]
MIFTRSISYPFRALDHVGRDLDPMLTTTTAKTDVPRGLGLFHHPNSENFGLLKNVTL